MIIMAVFVCGMDLFATQRKITDLVLLVLTYNKPIMFTVAEH